jgi:mono/diheme cytochrome c family protein
MPRVRKSVAAVVIARCLAVGGAALVLVPGIDTARGQTGAPASALTGVFDEAQAVRGQALYYAHCLSCHGEAMAGLDQAPPLAGPQFTGIWDGEPLAALVERIETMPPSNPEILTRAEAVDLLSYMLWYNGLPLGEQPLSAEPGVLNRMKFQSPPLPGQ